MTESHPLPPEALYLVDGSGFIFRAFHALPMMTRPDGTPVNAVLGFTNMLMKLLADLHASRVAVIFDAARRNWRNDIYPDYKAHRPPPPPELVPQFSLIREATEAFSLPAIEQEGFEADDLIATYARKARDRGMQVVIVSSDKDLMQLIGPGISLLDPIRYKPIGPAEVLEKFGVPPEKVIDVQALAGDSTDNVPGVPGIGVKTAAQLITEYGSLDNLLANAHQIPQPKRRELLQTHAEQARISLRLVRLDDQSPLPVPVDSLEVHRLDRARLRAFLEKQGFRSILARLDKIAPNGGPDEPAPPETLAEPLPSPVQDEPAAPCPVTRHYQLIQDVASLKQWIDRAMEQGFVAVDTETDSLEAVTARLVGVSLATAAGHACYIPLGHIAPNAQQAVPGMLVLEEEPEKPPQIPLDQAISLLKPMLEDPSVLKIGQNLKYDMQVLDRYGIRLSPWDDTMLISYVLDAGLHGHGMDELAKIHCSETPITYKDVTGTGKNQVTFDRVPLDRAMDYSAEDADITLRLHTVLKPRLVTDRMTAVYETIERPLVRVIADMERAGVKVDRQALAWLGQDFGQRMQVIEADLHRLAGQSFNPASPKQLGEILFDRMALPGGVRTRTGMWSTDSEVLEPLVEQGVEIAARILDWRQLAKLKNTYADALHEQINPQTGRVHTSFSMAATTTGRLASTNPNLQNIPIRNEEGRKIRQAFIAEPGHVLVSVDYSQIELRLAAHMADIHSLREAFHQGLDIHAATASRVFGVPMDQMTPEIRRNAKAINFGILYGMSGHGLARQLGIPVGEANTFVKRYLERYPEMAQYIEQTKAFCREYGYVKTLFGRRCHIPGINDRNGSRRAAFERQAINAPLQGTAADIIKKAMVRLPPALEKAGLKARLILQVHDELVLESPQEQAEETAAVTRTVMEAAASLSVPLVADAGVGPNWDAAH